MQDSFQALQIDEQPSVSGLVEHPVKRYPPQAAVLFRVPTADIGMHTREPEFSKILVADLLHQVLPEKPAPLVN
jgi:hypothetical protein